MTETPHRSDDTHDPAAMIVEDDVDLANLYATWLSKDFDVRTVHSGTDALDAFTERVDVIVLDRRLPDRSARELLMDMEKMLEDRGVVLISAVPPDFDVVEVGFDEYLTKPIDRAQLVNAVESVLDRSSEDGDDRTLRRLLATRNALRSDKPDSELRESDEYEKLQGRIDEIRATDDGTTEASDDGSSAGTGGSDSADDDGTDALDSA